MNPTTNTDLFALVYKNSGEVLHGRVYHKLGTAKSAFSHLCGEEKPNIVISRFVRHEDLVDGEELFAVQKEVKSKKLAEREKEYKQYRLEQAQREFREAQEKLNNLLKT